jgi:hypothetical protein
MPGKKYSTQAKLRFFKCLDNYKEALAHGTSHDIIITSLDVWAALGDAPASYERYINSAFKKIVREQPLDK